MNWFKLLRRVVVWGFAVLVLLGGLAGLFVWHSVRSYELALREFESRVGSPRLEDYLREGVPEEQNRLIAFERASAGVELAREWTKTAEPVGWNEQTEASAREALDRNRAALASLLLATQRPSCVWSSAQSADLGRLVPMLQAANLLRLDGFVAVADGEAERVEASFHTLGSLAECLYAAPNVIGSLIATKVERARLEVVHAAVSSSRSSAGLLEAFEVELEAISAIDRVRWAVAAEGAFALRLLEEQRLGRTPRASRLRTPFFRRMRAEYASRWVEFASWSQGSLEELIGQPSPAPKARLSMAGALVGAALPSLRHAIVGLRTNQSLIELARFAVEARLRGLRSGTYAGAFEARAGLDVLSDGDGSVVLIDSDLESLLRSHLNSAMGGSSASFELALDLTVWRLPAPARELSNG